MFSVCSLLFWIIAENLWCSVRHQRADRTGSGQSRRVKRAGEDSVPEMVVHSLRLGPLRPSSRHFASLCGHGITLMDSHVRCVMELFHASNPPKKAESLNVGCIHAELVKEKSGRKMSPFCHLKSMKYFSGKNKNKSPRCAAADCYNHWAQAHCFPLAQLWWCQYFSTSNFYPLSMLW